MLATHGMHLVSNTYLPVDMAWSYNFIGGLKDYVEPNYQLVDKAYHLVSTYVIHRHNFYMSGNGHLYNPVLASLYRKAEELGIPQTYFEFYCDNLFRRLYTCLDQIRQELREITPICNDAGDITGFVVGTALH